MIHCLAVGDPQPVVQWDKNNKVSNFDHRRFYVSTLLQSSKKYSTIIDYTEDANSFLSISMHITKNKVTHYFIPDITLSV